jgi:hypothetical protein
MAQPNYTTLASADMAYLVITVRLQSTIDPRRPPPPDEIVFVINGAPADIHQQFRELQRNDHAFMRKRYPDKFGGFTPQYHLLQVTQAKLYTPGRVQKLRYCKPGCCF